MRLQLKYRSFMARRIYKPASNIAINSEKWHQKAWTSNYEPKHFFFTHQCAQSRTPSLPNLEPKDQKSKKSAVKERLFGRFFDYIKNYELILEKLLPDIAFKYYKTFSNGSKSLFKDMKKFIYVYHRLSLSSDWEKSCKLMTKNQLEVYLTLPAELIRVAPVLIISAFPMAQNIAFPLAMWAPKKLLSVHFWSDEIRQEVNKENLKLRHSFYRSVFEDMTRIRSTSYGHYSNSPSVQSFVMTLNSSKDKSSQGIQQKLKSKEVRQAMYLDYQNNVKKVMMDHDKLYLCYRENMKKLITGKHPTVEEIMSMAWYFRNKDGPISLAQLPASHLRHLLRIHNRQHVGITSFISVRNKLQTYANMLLQIDLAIKREGLENMKIEELFQSCQARGLNVLSATEEEARDYLNQWLSVSNRLDSSTSSLLLHLPIFLGYNHKSRTCENEIANE